MRTIHFVALAGLGVAAALAATGCGPKCGDPDTVCVAVGTGVAGLDTGEGTPALDAPFYLPVDLTFGPDGKAYILDWNNHRVRAWDPASDTVTTVAGTTITSDGPPGPALESGLNHPTNIAFDSAGLMTIAGWHNSRVKRVDLGQELLEDICGTGMRTFSGDEGPAEMAGLDLPVGVAFDSAGNLYIADQANNRIRMVDGSGIIHTVVGTGRGSGINMMTMMPNPECIGASPAGTEDCFTDGDLDADDADPATGATINNPRGQSATPAGRIDIDASDLLYIADTANNAIRVVDFAAGTMTTIAGLGPMEGGFSGDGGPAVDARLFGPTDVDVAADGTIYVADTKNHCVRAIGADGNISTVVGVCGTAGTSKDTTPRLEALLNEPYGVDLGPDGVLYVADTSNNVIKAVYLSAP